MAPWLNLTAQYMAKLSNLWATSLRNKKKKMIMQRIMWEFQRLQLWFYGDDYTSCMRMSSSCVRCSKCDTIEGRGIQRRKLPGKNCLSPQESRTHDPPISRSDTLGTGFWRCYGVTCLQRRPILWAGQSCLFMFILPWTNEENWRE